MRNTQTDTNKIKMEKSNNNAVEIRYDADNNVTFEQLECGHIYYRHDLVNDRPEMIVSVAPNRHYEGKTPDNDAKIGYGFTVFVVSSSQNKPNLNHKIVFDIDDERLEVGAHPQSASLPESLEMFEKAMSKPIYTAIEFDLQPDDIKRFADARKIDMCLVSKDVYKVARGYNALDAGTIEGMKGVMKRAYHHFVDRTCYVDYCKKRKKQETEANNNQQERQGTQQKRNRKEQGQSKQKDVEYKVNDDAIEIKYDGMDNTTYECLKRGVIYADIGCDRSDMVIDIVPARYYKGKTNNDDAKIGFTISTKCCAISPEFQDKIVFDIDGERLVAETPNHGWVRKMHYKTFDEENTYSAEEINGINSYRIDVFRFCKLNFDLQTEDIKRLAEAKNVCVYFDSDSSYDVNGGSFEARNGWLLLIEGIQGVMKRAYYYFVDGSCYANYVKEYKEEKQRIENDKKIMEELRMQLKQEEQIREQKKVERKDKRFLIALIILVASIVSFIVGLIFVSIGLLLVSGIVGMACLIVMMDANDDFKNLIEQMTSNHNGSQGN